MRWESRHSELNESRQERNNFFFIICEKTNQRPTTTTTHSPPLPKKKTLREVFPLSISRGQKSYLWSSSSWESYHHLSSSEVEKKPKPSKGRRERLALCSSLFVSHFHRVAARRTSFPRSKTSDKIEKTQGKTKKRKNQQSSSIVKINTFKVMVFEARKNAGSFVAGFSGASLSKKAWFRRFSPKVGFLLKVSGK